MKSFARKFKRKLKILVGKDFAINQDYQVQSVRFGSDYGGWSVVTDQLDSASIIYSCGVGEDVSFDVALIENLNTTIHAFDPTPKSIDWCKKQNLPSDFILHEYGIADFDGMVLFNPPKNPNHVSHTILERPSTKNNAIKAPVKRLKTIMKKLGHKKIDLLKMDIEGAEYAVIKDMESSNIFPSQLLIEFHHRFPNVGIRKTKEAINAIKLMGYALFWVSESGEEYGFIKKNC